jgi:hypothetical protein
VLNGLAPDEEIGVPPRAATEDAATCIRGPVGQASLAWPPADPTSARTVPAGSPEPAPPRQAVHPPHPSTAWVPCDGSRSAATRRRTGS